MSCYQNDAELELGLGLSLRTGGGGGGDGGGGGGVKAKESPPWGGEYVKIMTAKDFPSSAGSKRGADCVGSPEANYSSSPVVSQVVGWPPIRTYRMNNLINQTKSANGDQEDKGVSGSDTSKDNLTKKVNHGRNNNDTTTVKERGHVGFVKVNMDGLPIGRKVNLSAHASYETLAQTLEDMFFNPSTTINSIRHGGVKKQPSKLLDGSSDFVLTYEDKEGDWLLVGDVPWGMFLNTAKRLRIMKTSEAPRFEQRHDKQKTKPI